MSKSEELTVAASEALAAAQHEHEPMARVTALVAARELLDEAYNEALAEAVVSGYSFREVAQAAGVAPNSVSPRLARSALLAPYASDEGRVGAQDVTIAQHELHQKDPAAAPMRFVPRRRGRGAPRD